MTVNRPWSDADDALLRAQYDSEPAAVLAQRLNRAVSAMYKRAQVLGLKKTRIHRTPGRMAYNAAAVGTIRRAGRQNYQFIKVKPGGWPEAWRRLHHVVWEREKGPVPDGYVLTFKDGDVDHIDIDNLELVHKDDWIKRYIPEHTLPPDLAEVIRLKATLTRALNQLKEEGNDKS